VGKPNPALPYDTSAQGKQGSWIPLAITAIASSGGTKCVSGGGVGAVTGSLVTIIGLNGTYGTNTGTRVNSQTASCGHWIIDVSPSSMPSAIPTFSTSVRPSVTSAPSIPTTSPSSIIPSSKPSGVSIYLYTFIMFSAFFVHEFNPISS